MSGAGLGNKLVPSPGRSCNVRQSSTFFVKCDDNALFIGSCTGRISLAIRRKVSLIPLLQKTSSISTSMSLIRNCLNKDSLLGVDISW